MNENRLTVDTIVITALASLVVMLGGCHQAAKTTSAAPPSQLSENKGISVPQHPPVIIHGGSLDINAFQPMNGTMVSSVQGIFSLVTTGITQSPCDSNGAGCQITTNWFAQICDTNPSNAGRTDGCVDGVNICTSNPCSSTGTPTQTSGTYTLWITPINPPNANHQYSDNVTPGGADPQMPAGYIHYGYHDGFSGRTDAYSQPRSMYIAYSNSTYGPFACPTPNQCFAYFGESVDAKNPRK
jgi:hypothetical protein